MRTLWILSVPVLVLSLAGCGRNKPTEPANLTPEQIEADLRNQKEAAAAEGVRQKSLPKTGQTAAEDSERRRAGGR